MTALATFEYRWRTPETLLSVEDYRAAARRRLPHMVWEYVDGGADDLVTLQENRAAFARWSLVPRVLRAVGQPDLRTTVAGVDLELPVLLAPTGFSGLAHWRGDVAAARAAERHGTRHVLSTSASWSIEELARATSARHFFQLYPKSGVLTRDLLRRAWDAGTRVMLVTVDVPVIGNREGERRRGMGQPPVFTPVRGLDALRHPIWLYGLLRHGRVGARNLVEDRGMRAAAESVAMQSRELMQSTLTWDDLFWLRQQWKGALLVKGVLAPEDAVHAADLGVDGVVVSNHGGRQLDVAQASLDALPGVVAAVGDRLEVLLDGGVRRGTDVVTALALGARAVLVGRPYLYGLAVGGEAGVSGVLDVLKTELERALALLGVHSAAGLDRTVLTRRNAR
ncbi:MAG: alpha-hydroxy acid oxidase [Mycobacteriales bacterium]